MFSNRNIFVLTVLLLVGFMQILYPVPSPVPTNQLFMMLGAGLILMMAGNDEYHVDMVCLAFVGTIVLSIVTNTIPAFFKPWSRFLQFAFLFIAGSPLLTGISINRARRQMTMGILWSTGIVSALSLAGYFLGFGQYITGGINGYMGVTAHPNFLGMFAFIAMIWYAALFFRCTEQWERIILGGLWIGNVILLLLSASRASLACGLLGSLIVVYLRLQRSAGKMMTAGFVLAALTTLSLPYLVPYAETMMKKDANNANAEESIAATRGYIWELRYMEIDESPYVGVGAYSCDITLPSADIFYSEATGSIEQGSSYLGLLAQTGWFGFLAFLLIILLVVWKAFRYATQQKTPYAQLMFALLVGIMGHMIFEGYAITAGAVQCVILWFVIGAAHQCDKVADYPVLWENEDPIMPEEYVQWYEEQEE